MFRRVLAGLAAIMIIGTTTPMNYVKAESAPQPGTIQSREEKFYYSELNIDSSGDETTGTITIKFDGDKDIKINMVRIHMKSNEKDLEYSAPGTSNSLLDRKTSSYGKKEDGEDDKKDITILVFNITGVFTNNPLTVGTITNYKDINEISVEYVESLGDENKSISLTNKTSSNAPIQLNSIDIKIDGDYADLEQLEHPDVVEGGNTAPPVTSQYELDAADKAAEAEAAAKTATEAAEKAKEAEEAEKKATQK